MNVLSLFDGFSCGQQALERAGIKVENYFASEIDKYAITVTMANYPNTKQLGSVVNVDGYSLPKIDLICGGSPCQSFSFAGKRKGMATKCETEILTLEQYLELKQSGFEFEGQSYLFWEYMRLLKEVKPKYFLLENVMMGDKWEKVLSKAIGVNPIEINSALVSAQNRRRLYWSNIGMQPSGLFGDLASIIEQPKDRGILLKDILEKDVDEKYFLSDKAMDYLGRDTLGKYSDRLAFLNKLENKKSTCITANHHKGVPYNMLEVEENLIVHNTMPRSSTTGKGGTGPLSRQDGKTYCLYTGNTNAVEIVAMRGRNPENPTSRLAGLKTEQQLEPRKGGKTNYLTSVQKDNLVMQINPSKESGGKQPYQHNRVYDIDGIAPCLNTDARSPAVEIKDNLVIIQKGHGFNEGGVFEGKSPTVTSNSWEHNNHVMQATGCDYRSNEGIRVRDGGKSGTLLGRARTDESCGQMAIQNRTIRRLTPTECERLQTVKDGFTNMVSDSQRYKLLGNGWTVEVIAHILSYIK